MKDLKPTYAITVLEQQHFPCNTTLWWQIDKVETCERPFRKKVLISVMLDGNFFHDTDYS
jgi:hypothetical protein